MSDAQKRILIVDDDATLRSQMKWAFESFRVFEAQDRKEAVALARRVEPDIVLLDLGLPPSPHETIEGFLALEEIRHVHPAAKIIVITGQDDRAVAREAVARGASDFFAKPPDLTQVQLIVARTLALSELEAENEKLAAQVESAPIPGVIARSATMLDLCRTIERVATSEAIVLLRGETGTGKKLLAQALHDLSARKNGPFVAVSCADLPAEQLAQDLFGADKKTMRGPGEPSKIDMANYGTLFLDGVEHLPTQLIGRLQRLAKEKALGEGQKTAARDVRIVAAAGPVAPDAPSATGATLAEIELNVPPLRDRDGDAALLARHFMREESRKLRVAPTKKLSTRALNAIATHNWPGNVKELRDRVKRALVISTRDTLEAADFDLADDASSELPTLREERRRSERKLVQRALTTTNGNVSEAARLLGVSRPTLYELLRSLDIPSSPA